MRLIDADKLKAHYAWWNNEEKELFDAIIDEQPIVGIIKCGECKYHLNNYIDKIPPYKHEYCFKYAQYVKSYCFCSQAERREK